MAKLTDPQGGIPADGSGTVSLADLLSVVATESVVAPTLSGLSEEYTPTQGRIGVASSSGRVYIGTGSAWTLAGNISTNSLTVGAGVDLSASKLAGLETVSNAGTGDIPDGGVALDTDRGGTGTTSLLVATDDGSDVHYVDVDGSL